MKKSPITGGFNGKITSSWRVHGPVRNPNCEIGFLLFQGDHGAISYIKYMMQTLKESLIAV